MFGATTGIEATGGGSPCEEPPTGAPLGKLESVAASRAREPMPKRETGVVGE